MAIWCNRCGLKTQEGPLLAAQMDRLIRQVYEMLHDTKLKVTIHCEFTHAGDKWKNSLRRVSEGSLANQLNSLLALEFTRAASSYGTPVKSLAVRYGYETH